MTTQGNKIDVLIQGVERKDEDDVERTSCLSGLCSWSVCSMARYTGANSLS